MKTETRKNIATLKQPGAKPVQATADKPQKRKNCKDNCMHCGSHCIYLDKWR